MGHVPGRPGGALLEQPHTGHIQLSVPERSGPGRKIWGASDEKRLPCAFRAFTLPREAYTLPYQDPGDPGQGIPHFCRSLESHPQAPLEETSLSGLDITQDLESDRHQD